MRRLHQVMKCVCVCGVYRVLADMIKLQMGRRVKAERMRQRWTDQGLKRNLSKIIRVIMI